MTSAHRDLTAMLRPRSIALVGATDRSRWSQNTFDNLINRKYPGEIHLVSRRGGTVHGRSAATSCVAVGAPIDLALLMVPMAAIDEALADLAAADVHNAVILTSGFAETGHEGADHQARLASLARQHNVSLLGPNCLGFVNFIDNVPLWTGGFRAPSQARRDRRRDAERRQRQLHLQPRRAARDRPVAHDLDRQRGRPRLRRLHRPSDRSARGARDRAVRRDDPPRAELRRRRTAGDRGGQADRRAEDRPLRGHRAFRAGAHRRAGRR